jgi:hypothetical protein
MNTPPEAALRRSLPGAFARAVVCAVSGVSGVSGVSAVSALAAAPLIVVTVAVGAMLLHPARPAHAAEGPAAQTGAGESQARLIARSVLPARTSRAGSPASGAFLTAEERATAAANGIAGPVDGPYFAAQPVQGISSLIPAENGTWWALADNGYAWRGNSADWQLVLYRIDPRWRDKAGPRLLETVTLRDPDRRIPWTIVCDPALGDALPGLSFNRLPLPPAFCSDVANPRQLSGFDFDPESFVRAPDGSFWVSEEFGPFLLHFSPDGKLLEAPVPVPGVRSPQNPFLDLSDRSRPERPTLAASRGFEGMAISPDGRTLYALLEGAVTGDDARDLRIYLYRTTTRRFDDLFLRVRLEAASQQVDLTRIVDERGERLYPDAVAPPPGPVSIGELKAVNAHQLLMIERDNLGDDERAPRFKKIFLLDLGEGGGTSVRKTLLLDLLALPDPTGVGGDGDFFRLPFYTLESVHVVDERTLVVASDNNFPFSNGRARSRSTDRKGPLAADDSELVLIRLGTPLEVDSRLLPKLVGKGRP